MTHSGSLPVAGFSQARLTRLMAAAAGRPRPGFLELPVDNPNAQAKAPDQGVPHTVVNRGGNEIRLRGFDAGAFERVFGGR